MAFVLKSLSFDRPSSDKRKDKEDNKNEKQYFSYTCGSSGDSSKTEYGCNNSYYQKNNSPP